MTYNELNEKANMLARVFMKKVGKIEARQDFVVALRFLPSLELIISILALFKAGLAYVPLAPNWPEGRVKFILDQIKPIFVLTNTKADILYNATKSGQSKPEIFQVMTNS